jgi:nucleotide-binding universal stress UspA family protein
MNGSTVGGHDASPEPRRSARFAVELRGLDWSHVPVEAVRPVMREVHDPRVMAEGDAKGSARARAERPGRESSRADHVPGGGPMTRCVICGIDDSPAARKAAGVAAMLSEKLEARLVMMHAARLPVPAHGMPYYDQALEDAVKRGGMDLIERVQRDCGMPVAEAQVRLGPAANVLTEAAARLQADLIVVGTRGRGALKAAILGSVSSEVLSGASCPVVVVPPDANEPAES